MIFRVYISPSNYKDRYGRPTAYVSVFSDGFYLFSEQNWSQVVANLSRLPEGSTVVLS